MEFSQYVIMEKGSITFPFILVYYLTIFVALSSLGFTRSPEFCKMTLTFRDFLCARNLETVSWKISELSEGALSRGLV